MEPVPIDLKYLSHENTSSLVKTFDEYFTLKNVYSIFFIGFKIIVVT